MEWKAAIAILAFGLLAAATPADSAPATVTVGQVLANPTLYNSKTVRVRGFATFEFENNRLWRDEAAFRAYDDQQAVRVSTEGVTRSARDAAKGHLAYVTGIFRAGGYGQDLTQVTAVQRDPSDHGRDRSWYSDPDFTALVAVLSSLALVIIGLAFGAKAQGLVRQPAWTARKSRF